jgi:uncharacterized protein (DUF433 family)
MAATNTIAHIILDDQGRAWVDDTNVKVSEIVQDHLAYGWNADTIHEHHPHLSLAQVYAAPAWYYDHQAEIDADFARQEEHLQELRAITAPSALARRALRRNR